MIATQYTALTQLFENLRENSKVWIYTSNLALNPSVVEDLNQKIEVFAKQWTAHDIALKASGAVLFNQFIVLSVDESQTNASGCSIDKSVHFIQDIEKQLSIQLFDRLTIFYLNEGEMKSFHFGELQAKIERMEISAETEIFDTTITQLDKLRTEFIKKAKDSWLSRYFK